jgi:PPK2 family polyphosphate:nucleotide phosphotransferase
MKLTLSTKPFRITGAKKFRLAAHPTELKTVPFRDEAHYDKLLTAYRGEIDQLQQQLYADSRHSVLLIFQARDAAGKDSTIRHVMTGVSPVGVHVTSFKRPSDEEIDHDFLWRCQRHLPERGRIGIFNRSYYEEVLVCKVHPTIVTGSQRLPAQATADMKALWKDRYRDLRAYERYLHTNGTTVIKFFLNVSKDEQRRRFLDRIDDPAKNWKFAAGDLAERAKWDDYSAAYETAIRETATADSPWFVIPADDKKTMRLLVSQVVLDTLRGLQLKWPKLSAEAKAELARCREELLAE